MNDPGGGAIGVGSRSAPTFIAALLGMGIGLQELTIGPIRVADVVILLAILMLLLSGPIARAERTYAMMLCVVVSYLLMSLTSIDMVRSIEETIRLTLSLLVLPIVLTVVRGPRGDATRALILGALSSAILVLVWAVLESRGILPQQVFFRRDLVRILVLRLKGFYIDPNYFAFSCVIIQLVFSYHRKLFSRRGYLLGTLVLGICVLLSQSRTGISAYLMVFVLSYLFAGEPHRRRNILVPLVIAAFLGILYLLNTFGAIIERFQASSPLDDVRLIIWKHGMQAFVRAPFGSGPGTFRLATAVFGGTHDSHNTFVGLLVNNGIVFFGMLAIVVIALLVSHRWSRLEIVAIPVLVFMSMFFNMDTFRPTYLLIGTMVAVQRSRPFRSPGALV